MKNYTSLEKMKASDVAPSFTEEKVTAETFKEEVAKGTLYKGFEPPKDATMLKFRYYSPDGTLIEQNNVPVVYDGTGVESVKTYYLLTDKSSGITVEKENGKIKTGTSPEEWSETVKTVTKDKRFLWTCTETLYTNKAVEYTEPCISAVYGEQGERGAMYLGHYADNQAAYEANKPAVFDGDYYLNTTTKYIRKYLGDNKWSDDIDDYTNYRYNQAINDIFAIIESLPDDFLQKKMIWVKNLVAITARIQQAIVNTLVLSEGTDLDGNTKGGVIQSDNYDGTIQNGAITKAGKNGWAIDYTGKAEFNNVTVRGTVEGSTISGGTVNGTKIKGGSININDNFTVDSEGNLIAKTGTFGENCNFKGFITQNDIIECTLGYISFAYYNSKCITFKKSLNIYNIYRYKRGQYIITFNSISPMPWNEPTKAGLYPLNLFTSNKTATKSGIDEKNLTLSGHNAYQLSLHFANITFPADNILTTDKNNNITSTVYFDDYVPVSSQSSGVSLLSFGAPCNLSYCKKKIGDGTGELPLPVYMSFYAIGLCCLDRNNDAYQDPVGGCVMAIKAFGKKT